jgi:hypothetical protein
MATTTTVGAPAKSGELLSERIAPGILPKSLVGRNTARRAGVAG